MTNEVYKGVWRYGKSTRRKEDTLVISVPAIIEDETWTLAQNRLTKNRLEAKRNRKYNYLLSSRVICQSCGSKMVGRTNGKLKSGERRAYYSCPAAGGTLARTCNHRRYFRAKKVDGTVWHWIEEITSNPDYLKSKLYEYQQHQDEGNKPIYKEISAIDDLLMQHRNRRQKWLKMYEADVIDLAELKEKQAAFDKAISSLEARQTDLMNLLQGDLTDEVIEDVIEFARIIREEVGIMAADFEKRRYFVEMLDLQAKLVVEDGQHIVYASVRLGKGRTEKRLSVVSKVS